MSVLVIDKPSGPTSFDVVRRARQALARWLPAGAKQPRVGHGGTLDPMASGVLPLCIGEGTKLAPFLLDADKAYEAEVRFGAETDTLDAEGHVVAEYPTTGLTLDRVREALAGFVGEIEQVPPMYSALKRDGRPLYELARAGVEVPRAARPVTIRELVLREWLPPDRVRFFVRCSKGTYVRVLAADLGRVLGGGAHLSALRRTVSGPFAIEHALTPAQFDMLCDAGGALPLVSLADALAHLPVSSASPEVTLAFEQGRRVSLADLGIAPAAGAIVPTGPLRVLRPDGSLCAVASPRPDGTLATLRVFSVNRLTNSGF